MLYIAVLCQHKFSKSPMTFITSAHKNYTAEILAEQRKGRKDAMIDTCVLAKSWCLSRVKLKQDVLSRSELERGGVCTDASHGGGALVLLCHVRRLK